MNYTDHDYSRVSNLANLYTIKSDHLINDLLIFSDIISGRVVDDNLKNKFEFRNLDYNLRSHRHFKEIGTTNDSIFHSPSYRFSRLWNGLSKDDQNLMNDRNALKSRLQTMYSVKY